jgi:Tn3 transposase DDE domain
MRNTSEIQPEIVHSDSHGQSEAVFGLAYLLGIKLMPRIKNWKHLTFYRHDKKARYEHIDALFSVFPDGRLRYVTDRTEVITPAPINNLQSSNAEFQEGIALRFARCEIPLPAAGRQSPFAELMGDRAQRPPVDYRYDLERDVPIDRNESGRFGCASRTSPARLGRSRSRSLFVYYMGIFDPILSGVDRMWLCGAVS